jgi:multiple sugar transport system ATP-binding protein
MANVTFSGVAKQYGKVSVIKNLDLEVRDHEFMVLVGPSGCGKSTALRMLAGLEEISGGTIAIDGKVVNDLPPKDRDIAMVFQNYALYPHMTVRENLDFGLRIRKTPKAETDRLIAEASEVLGITHLLERKPRELSGGQRQRVAVGRAIVRKPSVFLFDEPLSNLDAKLRVQMRAEISKLQNRLRTTTVYVTHDQVEAMTMGHRIAVMKDGDLKQVGTPLDLYEKPANLFVASFIGTPPMNFVTATLSDGGSLLSASGFVLPVPAALRPATRGKDGRKVIVGIRPENILEPGKPARGETARLTVEVDIVEPLGHEVIVHGRIGENVLVAKLDPHGAPKMGALVELVVELDALHLFDAETELRLGA